MKEQCSHISKSQKEVINKPTRKYMSDANTLIGSDINKHTDDNHTRKIIINHNRTLPKDVIILYAA